MTKDAYQIFLEKAISNAQKPESKNCVVSEAALTYFSKYVSETESELRLASALNNITRSAEQVAEIKRLQQIMKY